MLTDRQIQAALKTAEREVILNDRAAGRGTGSLRLVIRPTKESVSATWVGYWVRQGQRQKKTIGRYPHLSLRDARDKFDSEVRKVLQDNKNPHGVAVQTAEATLEAMFQGYIDHMKRENRASVPEVTHALMSGCLGAAVRIGRSRLAAKIDPSDISAFLEEMYARGSRTGADRVRAYMSAAFNWAIRSAHDYTTDKRIDWGIKINPVSMVPRDQGAKNARDRVLTKDELAMLWHAVDGPGFAKETKIAVRLLICCGQRVRETLRLEPHEIVDGVWIMPKDKTKCGKQDHLIPMPALAMEVLKEFDGFELDDHSISQAIRRWGKLPDFQPRDIRRTWKTLTGDIGIDRFTRDLLQQHAQNDTGSKHYDRAKYMPEKRAAMDKWNDWLAAVIESPNER